MNDHRIVREACIVDGDPVVRRMTRVILRTARANLAAGTTTAEIPADFPTLTEADVRAAIEFAATSAQEDLPIAESPVSGKDQARREPAGAPRGGRLDSDCWGVQFGSVSR